MTIFLFSQIHFFRVLYNTVNCSSYVVLAIHLVSLMLMSVSSLPFSPHIPTCTSLPPFLCPYAPNSLEDSCLYANPCQASSANLALRSRCPGSLPSGCYPTPLGSTLLHCSEGSLQRCPTQPLPLPVTLLPPTRSPDALRQDASCASHPWHMPIWAQYLFVCEKREAHQEGRWTEMKASWGLKQRSAGIYTLLLPANGQVLSSPLQSVSSR